MPVTFNRDRGRPAPKVMPKVGDGGTICLYTDRHAATVIGVSASGKTIQVQRDFAKRTDKNGMSESQEYEYSPNPNGEIIEFRMTNSGVYKDKYGLSFYPGDRREYYDYNF